MKFNIIVIFFFLFSCTVQTSKINNKIPYNTKGFAYIYNEEDFKNKIIKGKMENSKIQVSHNGLKLNALLKIINPKTKDYLVVKNQRRINFPEFYKILITEEVARKLNLDLKLPLVEIFEIKKNKSFIAKKAETHKDEKKISSNAPVTSVKISNISKNKDLKKKNEKTNFFILIASFYSEETAEFLKKRIAIEIPNYDMKKLKILKETNNKIDLISGPYNTINLIKNDYIQLKNFGFEELDIISND